MPSQLRCVNLDWLEVSVWESAGMPRDCEYFRSLGMVVHARDYGTKVWGEVFTIEGEDHLPFIEVRRAPRSEIIASFECHLRLVNRVCYFDHAAQLMMDFISRHGYIFQRISRVDVCLDFVKFDMGDDPAKFLKRFMMERYSKINQARISAHGDDSWGGRVWNSVSWGSPHSDISTKFYCKTLELYDPVTRKYGKPYIRQAWHRCGLVDDPVECTVRKDDGTSVKVDVWRVEFSIKSSVKKWFVINPDGNEKIKQSIRNTLDVYDGRDRLLVLFASLSRHYFRFKYVVKRYQFYKEGHSDGYMLRKDRCPDKVLFVWPASFKHYQVGKDSVATSEKLPRNLLRLIAMLQVFRDTTHDMRIKNMCEQLIRHLQERVTILDQTNPLNRAEEEAWRIVLRLKSAGNSTDPVALFKDVLRELQIRPQIAPPF